MSAQKYGFYLVFTIIERRIFNPDSRLAKTQINISSYFSTLMQIKVVMEPRPLSINEHRSVLLKIIDLFKKLKKISNLICQSL